MEKYFATFALVFTSLAVGFTALDVTVESVDNHSPFSEQTDGDWENGNRLFTKEELANYNGEDVGVVYNTIYYFLSRATRLQLQELLNLRKRNIINLYLEKSVLNMEGFQLRF